MNRNRRRAIASRARELLYKDGVRWPQALAQADAEARCGARCKKNGKSCPNRPVPGQKRCRVHGGIVRPWTPEERVVISQRVRAQPRDALGWFVKQSATTTNTGSST